ncbi:hypothetical protein EsH8_IV_000462 [Colletotrichum jinshuiense]
MPGLIPFLPTPPLPQPTRTASSSASGRPANSFLGADRGAVRGNSSQAPIELDDDPEPAPASGPPAATHTQPQQDVHFDHLWGIPTPDSTQHQHPLPPFSDFAANLDYEYSNSTALLPSGAPQTPGHEPGSDDFLSALIDGNFSSPSSYPQFTQASSGTQQANRVPSPPNQVGRHPPGTSLRPNRPASNTNTSSQNRAVATVASQRPTPHPTYLDSEVEESLFVSSDEESKDTMPVQTRRRASTIISSDHEPDDVVAPTTRKRTAPSSAPTRGAAAPKRRRTSQTQATRTQITSSAPQETVPNTESDIFGDEEDESDKGKVKDGDVIDLAVANEVPEEMRVPKEDKRIKISAFQCVICMDDVTALTVTHCGHLFCSECLHSALNVDATKNKCPICRQKVETKDRSEYTSKTKGFWPLELKLMTASRKGKQRA